MVKGDWDWYEGQVVPPVGDEDECEECTSLRTQLSEAQADYNDLHNAARDVYFYACDGMHITDERDEPCLARLNVILSGKGAKGHNPEVCVDVQEAYDALQRRYNALREAAEAVLPSLEQHRKMLSEESAHWAFSIAYDKLQSLRAALADEKEKP